MEWQPIETAPKDKPIIAWGPVTNVTIAKWGDLCEQWLCCGWYQSKGSKEPTHWMPLPEPPA